MERQNIQLLAEVSKSFMERRIHFKGRAGFVLFAIDLNIKRDWQNISRNIIDKAAKMKLFLYLFIGSLQGEEFFSNIDLYVVKFRMDT